LIDPGRIEGTCAGRHGRHVLRAWSHKVTASISPSVRKSSFSWPIASPLKSTDGQPDTLRKALSDGGRLRYLIFTEAFVEVGDGKPALAVRVHRKTQPEMADGFQADAPGLRHIGEGFLVLQETVLGRKDQTGIHGVFLGPVGKAWQMPSRGFSDCSRTPCRFRCSAP